MSESIRADKWLWATRFFKTRGLAAEICAKGEVKRNGHPLKPASPVHPGDLLEIPFVEGPGLRRISVKAVIGTRVGAPQARACYEDLTDPSVHEALQQWQAAKREAGKGRPTKLKRRRLDQVHSFWDE
jgi:ribosome-associated heat shock protein Hsp15